jgi:AcrR family transcriptional regulator
MTSTSSAAQAGLRGGLRERKKARTRAAIRETAMRLFEQQGYAATTVDQIAEAAEVSQSTFFRYFPTKEDVVLTDDYDPMLVEAIRAQPADLHPIDALMAAMRSVFGSLTPEEADSERRRQALFERVPELRSRVLQQTVAVIDLLADVIAERAGLPAGNLSARTVAGAVVGVVLAVTPSGSNAFHPEARARIEQALTLLRDGLPLR